MLVHVERFDNFRNSENENVHLVWPISPEYWYEAASYGIEYLRPTHEISDTDIRFLLRWCRTKKCRPKNDADEYKNEFKGHGDNLTLVQWSDLEPLLVKLDNCNTVANENEPVIVEVWRSHTRAQITSMKLSIEEQILQYKDIEKIDDTLCAEMLWPTNSTIDVSQYFPGPEGKQCLYEITAEDIRFLVHPNKNKTVLGPANFSLWDPRAIGTGQQKAMFKWEDLKPLMEEIDP